ncbi:IS66 family insertion sequence element accessory protein TnpB [Psychrobium sp. nBUS_13]|uniref:IS66 family insertion sequence element accessory protein TnpB n=1 Tax=Psychrobium sp. nBUS_13 TaxID=3395319 RepID=UPI003EB9ACF2
MKMFIQPSAVYLHRDPVAFRKQIDGLAAIVELTMKESLSSGALFVFCSKQRNKLKLLYWDKTGFCLWYKRLEKDKFKWPKKHEPTAIKIDEEQLLWLLRGFDISAIKPHRYIEFDSVF